MPELDPGQMANSSKYESRLFLLIDGRSVAGDSVRARFQGGAQQGARRTKMKRAKTQACIYI